MVYFNKILTSILPIFPRFIIKPFAMRYVAGETLEDAVKVVQNINQKGFCATLDILGEHTDSLEKAISIKDSYINLYDTIEKNGLDCNVSIKLTHLGLEFDSDLAKKNIKDILHRVSDSKNFLRIDMENSPYTSATLNIYKKLIQHFPNVGVVLQAYLHRSMNDLKQYTGNIFNVRICKGIYNEPPEIAFQNREDIRDNFINLVQTVLQGEGYVGIATHDHYLIDTLETWILNKKIPTNRYEFQVLYGVPMKGRLEQLLNKGHKVRIYVPFGKEWYDYSTRRLKENPHLAGYILKNLFHRH